MKILPLVVASALAYPIVVFAASRCDPTEHGYSGGDGSSITQAVVICGAKSEKEGVIAERVFLEHAIPAGTLKSQKLVTGVVGDVYDKYTFTGLDGSDVVVFFDITDFFGR